MRIFCATCRTTFPAEAENIVYDNGSDLAVFKCDKCGIHYLAANDEKSDKPILFKLTKTKSFVTDKERSRLVAPTGSRLVITPSEAAAELRGRK